MPAKQPATRRYKSMQRRAVVKKPQAKVHRNTAIQQCVHAELSRYFEMLDGEAPLDLYRMVMQQTEAALLTSVLEECRGNQSKAATWLGINRGTLRAKLAALETEDS